jgi:hypothetical protein
MSKYRYIQEWTAAGESEPIPYETFRGWEKDGTIRKIATDAISESLSKHEGLDGAIRRFGAKVAVLLAAAVQHSLPAEEL